MLTFDFSSSIVLKIPLVDDDVITNINEILRFQAIMFPLVKGPLVVSLKVSSK